jgi:predicted nucleotide-binding protein
MPPRSAIKILEKIDRLISIPQAPDSNSPVFVKWKQDCLRLLAQVEGQNSTALKSFEDLDFEGNSFGMSVNQSAYTVQFHESLWKAQAILQSVRDAVVEEAQAVYSPNTATNSSAPQNKKVFVVHGHDEKLKVQVARFLEKLELEPVILHEQADRGLTIIEKFEKHSEVSFAVVLLSPDDAGGKLKEEFRWMGFGQEMETETLKARARQNVIFEFGYFIGKLGRANVCGLYCEGVELPSDYSGVLYTKVDDGGAWQFNLLKELKAAGFAVDANRLT